MFAAGCGSSSTGPTAASSSSGDTSGGGTSASSYFRRDVTEGKSGLSLALTLTIVNVKSSCAPLAGANVEIWQCDATGNYSEYSQPGFDGTGQTFLRGIQTSDANGRVTFNTIYPGWYMGRATHIHVEVFVNGAAVKTTQIAFPEIRRAAMQRP